MKEELNKQKDRLLREIEFERKWLKETERSSYDIDIALDAIKYYVAQMMKEL